MSLRVKTKNILSYLVRFGLSAILLVYLFSKIDLEKTSETLKNADLNYIYLGAAIFLAIHFIILMRWMFFLKSLDIKVSLQSVISCFFIGLFFNLFLPTSTGGDIIKTWFLFKDTTEKAKVVASVVADRLWGFISIVIVATVAFMCGYRLLNDNTLLFAIVILASVSFTATLVLFNESLYSTCCRVFSRLPRIKERLMSFHYAIALLKNKKFALFIPIGLSCFSQVLLAISFYFVAKGLHLEISFIYFLIFVPIICVVSSLPSIGGLGFRDLGAVYLFAKVGVETGTAVSMSLINFLFMALAGLIGGVFYVIALSPRRVQCYQADSDISPEET